MAEFLGFAASVGMLSLIGCLIVLFLLEAGAMKKEAVKNLFYSFLMAAGVGAAYFLTAALICQLTRQEISSPALISTIFSGEKTKQAFAALEHPAWIGPLSGLFAYAGHAAGILLFGQFETAGIALAFLMTVVSAALIKHRLQALLGDQAAKDISFLLLCFPGDVFFFLPGFMPVALLIFAVAFSLLGRRFAPSKAEKHVPAYGLVLSVSMTASAFILSGAVSGWIM
ncbi:MAG: hypothetical protein IKQ41_05670 [Clostridia bacterium]|nr:hypothetical protein [Clostridia bacterium]